MRLVCFFVWGGRVPTKLNKGWQTNLAVSLKQLAGQGPFAVPIRSAWGVDSDSSDCQSGFAH